MDDLIYSWVMAFACCKDRKNKVYDKVGAIIHYWNSRREKAKLYKGETIRWPDNVWWLGTTRIDLVTIASNKSHIMSSFVQFLELYGQVTRGSCLQSDLITLCLLIYLTRAAKVLSWEPVSDQSITWRLRSRIALKCPSFQLASQEGIVSGRFWYSRLLNKSHSISKITSHICLH